MSTGIRSIVIGAFGAAFAASGAQAEDLPAVSALNGKVEYTGGNIDGASANLGAGSVALPLGGAFGAQVDAAGGNLDGTMVKGVGAHLFWRDPDLGLVGAVASRTGFDTVWGSRFGIEGEAYFGPVTVAVTGGWQTGEFRHTGWGTADLRFYPLADLMLEAGAARTHVSNSGHLGVEWRPGLIDAVPGLALFGDAGFGDGGYDHALAGIRVYFGGGDKPLRQRHRQDDPLNMLVGGIAQAAGPSGSNSTGSRSTGTSVSGGGGGGGQGGCFVAGTEVLMADGTVNTIKAVKAGDKLLGADGAVNEVLELKRPTLGDRQLYAINGGAGFVTDSHPFMTKDGWKSADPAATAKENPGLAVGRLVVGDILTARDGTVTIATLEGRAAAASTPLYNFSVSGNRTYFVRPPSGQGPFLLVHNK